MLPSGLEPSENLSAAVKIRPDFHRIVVAGWAWGAASISSSFALDLAAIESRKVVRGTVTSSSAIAIAIGHWISHRQPGIRGKRGIPPCVDATRSGKTIVRTLRRESTSTEARSAGRRVSRWPEIVSGCGLVLHERVGWHRRDVASPVERRAAGKRDARWTDHARGPSWNVTLPIERTAGARPAPVGRPCSRSQLGRAGRVPRGGAWDARGPAVPRSRLDIGI
jgi:hypothetical protein